MQSRSIYWILGVAMCPAACQPTPTTPIGIETARARVSGSVATPGGTLLSNVLVAIHLPVTIAPLGYRVEPGTTGSDGQFQADVVRLGAPTIAVPDTITAYVVATASGPQYKPSAGGAFPTDSVPVRVQFWPAGQAPVPSVTQLRVVIP